MSKAARSVLYFAYYLIALSVMLVVAPNVLLGMFGMPATTEVWIRVVGVTVFCLGAYYIVAARTGFLPLIRLTVPVRVAVCGAFAAFLALGWAPPPLVLFGLVDLGGAVVDAGGTAGERGIGGNGETGNGRRGAGRTWPPSLRSG